MPVLYGDTGTVKPSIARVAAALRTARERGVSERQAGLMGATALFRIAAASALQTKDPSWASEREWRLIAAPRPNRDHKRRISTDPRPHILLELHPGNRPELHSIRIGPAHPDPAGAEVRLNRMLSSLGYPQCAILQSARA